MCAIVFATALFGMWIGAWLVERALETQFAWLHTEGARFAYWLVAKFIIWVLPSVFLIRIAGKRLGEVVAFNRWRAILGWGGGIGLLLGAMTLTISPAQR